MAELPGDAIEAAMTVLYTEVPTPYVIREDGTLNDQAAAANREVVCRVLAAAAPFIAARVHTEDGSGERRRLRSASALRRLPLGSVVLSHRQPYEGWAWQKTAHEEWWARDNNWMPDDRMVAFLGPLTVIYRPEARHGVG